MGRNQRDSKRIPFRSRVKYGTEEHLSFGYTNDLSLNGVGLYGKRVMPPKTKVKVHLEINSIPVTLNGVVVHAKSSIPGQPSRMGIRFLKSPAMIKALYNSRANSRK